MNQLHPIAQAVQSQGRGNDTQLVHMTPNEVQGLQALAKAHGGSLSINPSTGLPEAGFLDSLLPTILGAGLAAATGGSSLMIGAGLGALQYARTGSLEKGLMAGLGAYGGAGLGQSLMGAGALANTGTMSPMNKALEANLAAKQAVGSASGAVAKEAAQKAAEETAKNLAAQQASVAAQNTFTQNLSNMGTGLKAAAMSPSTFMDAYAGSGMDLAKYGGAAAAPMLMQQPQTTTPPSDNEQYQYTYNPNRASEEDLAAQRAANPQGELRYFNPQYQGPRMVRVAQGGELDYAGGGTIDLSGTINLGGQGAQGGLGAGRPNNSFAEGPAGGLGAMLGGLNRGIEGLFGGSPMSPASGNPMMLSNARYDGRALPKQQTYEQYLAGRSPVQQDVQLTREQFERANNASWGDPGAMDYGSSPNSMFAEGGAVDYEYDPVTQMYKKKTTAPMGAVAPVGIAGGDSSGSQPLTQSQIDFLEKEEQTPGARNVRMGKINDIIAMLAPGAMAAKAFQTVVGATPTDTRMPVETRNVTQNPGSDTASYQDYSNMSQQELAESGGGVGAAKGGLLSLAAGGMSRGGFVVPADVVSALGNGSTDAGLRTLQAKMGAVKPIKGKGDGLSDSIPTSIDGKQPARVADGEAYIPPETVAKMGGGDPKKGAKKLYAMMDKIRQQAHGKTSQQRKVSPDKVV